MPSVKVYTRTTCAPCQMLKRWLQNKNVPYTEVNVDDDPELMDEIIQQTGFQMVPTVKVGDQYIQGLNIALLAKTLML